MFEFDVIGDHTELAYSSIGLVIVLKVVVRVSLSWAHVFEDSALRIFMVDFAFTIVLLMCSV